MILVGPYHRHRPYERERLAMTDRLLAELREQQRLREEIAIAAMECRIMSEPLDGVDEPEDWKRKQREIW